MLHQFGSQLIVVPGLTLAAVPALVPGPPIVPGIIGPGPAQGQNGPGTFQWSRDDFVNGVLVMPTGTVLGIREELAKLTIAITDNQGKQLVGDGRGITQGRLLPNGAMCLALIGQGLRPFALQAPVRAADIWNITIQNLHTAILTLAGVYFYVEKRGKKR